MRITVSMLFWIVIAAFLCGDAVSFFPSELLDAVVFDVSSKTTAVVKLEWWHSR
jgi:MFS superfamily sulfate permease-like transporter